MRSTLSAAPYLECTLKFMDLACFRSEIFICKDRKNEENLYCDEVDGYILELFARYTFDDIQLTLEVEQSLLTILIF